MALATLHSRPPMYCDMGKRNELLVVDMLLACVDEPTSWPRHSRHQLFVIWVPIFCIGFIIDELTL